MSIFNTILQKLGIQKPAATAPAAAKPAEKPAASKPAPYTPVSSKPEPMSEVDVVSKLDKLAGENSGLDWKVSIVDLLKLLKMDSGLEARKELATELGCPADLMGGDYSKMNVWLHKVVLQKIAENGGNIPQSLLK